MSSINELNERLINVDNPILYCYLVEKGVRPIKEEYYDGKLKNIQFHVYDAFMQISDLKEPGDFPYMRNLLHKEIGILDKVYLKINSGGHPF